MDKLDDWRQRPTSLEEFTADIDYIMFVDENGHSTQLGAIQKKLSKGKNIDRADAFFTVTGCVIKRSDFPQIRQSIIQLKERYWPPSGEFEFKGKSRRVCFHSRNIRRCDEPFSTKNIDRNRFLDSLSNFMDNSPFTIFSSTLDMELHARRYANPRDPYGLCMDLIIERFGKHFLRRRTATGVVLLEARGKKEDTALLNHCVRILNYGTDYVSSSELSSIKGVYFNTKWSPKWNFKRSYFGLEIADLSSYPIHKFVRDNVRDLSFEILESKLYGYPNYLGKGLKIFP